jgi:hypothetical protein
MAENSIPYDVKLFILKSIDSIAQLEALLLLRGNQAEEWEVEQVAKRLYISEPETAPLLKRLADEGFITARGDPPLRYQYQPCSPELAQMIDRLAELYAKQLVPVTNLIHSKPRTRIQEFADAFRLRKDD